MFHQEERLGTLDWDLWPGPAPERPFSPAYLPFKWRGWWDFRTGALDLYFVDLDGGFKIKVQPMADPVTKKGGPTEVIRRDAAPRLHQPNVRAVVELSNAQSQLQLLDRCRALFRRPKKISKS